MQYQVLTPVLGVPAVHESANFDYRFPAAEQSDWCTFRVSNGAMGTVAFAGSLKVLRH